MRTFFSHLESCKQSRWLGRQSRVLRLIESLVRDPALRLEIFTAFADDNTLFNLAREEGGLNRAVRCGLSKARYIDWLKKYIKALADDRNPSFALDLCFEEDAPLTMAEVLSIIDERTQRGESLLAAIAEPHNARSLFSSLQAHGLSREEVQNFLGPHLASALRIQLGAAFSCHKLGSSIQ